MIANYGLWTTSAPAHSFLNCPGCSHARMAKASSCNIDSCYCSVAKSCLTLRSHGLQHTRLPRPLLSPGVCSNSCSLSRWCHLTVSSFVIPFFSCQHQGLSQSFPTSGSFPVSQLFTLIDQSIGASASASVLLMNIQCWFPFYYNNNHSQTSVPSVSTLLLLHLNKPSTLGDYSV